MNSIKAAFQEAEKTKQRKRAAPKCKDCDHLDKSLWTCRALVGKPCYTKPDRTACLLFEVKKR